MKKKINSSVICITEGMEAKFIDDDSFDVFARGKAARSSRLTGRARIQGGKDE